MRFWPGLTSLVMVSAAAPAVARAEVPADSVKMILKTPESEEVADSTMYEDFSAPTDDVKARQFNRARCECDESGATQNVMFELSWATRPADPSGDQLFVWVGSDCAGAANRDDRLMRCSTLASIPDAIDLDDGENKFERVGALLTPGTNNAMCSENITSVTYGLYTSDDGEATIDPVVSLPIDVDMKAPPVPTELTVNAQEGQISLAWDALTSEAGDIDRFYALCAKAGGALAHDTPTTEDARYDTVDSLCGGAPIEAEAVQEATISNDAQQTGAPITSADLGDLAYLDKRYVCGEASATSKSIELKGLENGVSYLVVLVSLDKAGNPRAAFVPRLVSPQPVTDFWEDLNEENGELEGGLCLVESTYGAGGGGLNGALRAWRDELRQTAVGSWLVDRYYAWGAPLAAAAQESVVARVVLAVAMLPLVAVALVWHAIGLPAMLAIALALVVLRRRRRKLVVAAALALLAPSVAAAQSMTPYWDDDLAAESSETEGPSWHFGLRLGPYLPGIDDDRFGDPGPYERMFGGGSWMPAVDLHRVWNTRFGQLGGGGSVGYFQKTAEAYIPGTDMRAEGNENTLKIVPMELTAIWRGTMFHDNWSIPLVPYARGGLGYYLWWVRRPDGDLAKACPPNMTNCDRAIGGSLGLVAAAGLSIRAEGIDPSAARSMRDSGLDHAGFYAELEVAWVDGFGNAKKLSLGDTTWFAGIDFEF